MSVILRNQLTPLFGEKGRIIFCMGLFSAAFSSFIVNSMIGGFLLSDSLKLGSKPDQKWPKIFTAGVLNHWNARCHLHNRKRSSTCPGNHHCPGSHCDRCSPACRCSSLVDILRKSHGGTQEWSTHDYCWRGRCCRPADDVLSNSFLQNPQCHQVFAEERRKNNVLRAGNI